MGKTSKAWVAAGVLLIAACGGDDGDSGGDAETSTGSASSFCEGYNSMEDKWSNFDSLNTDPDKLADEHQKVYEDFKNLQPPEELADDWGVLMEFMSAQMIPQPDPEDEEAVAKYQEDVTAALEDLDQEQFNKATTAIESYVTDECGAGSEPPVEGGGGAGEDTGGGGSSGGGAGESSGGGGEGSSEG